MERFEYGAEKIKYEKLKERAQAFGLKQYQIDDTLISDDFGSEINNSFPSLSEDDEKMIKFLCNKRELATVEREQVIRVLDPLIQREKKLSMEIDDLNTKICYIQGHRLAEDSLRLTDTNGYGYICLVCNRFIRTGSITDKDVLVNKLDGPKKIRYKK